MKSALLARVAGAAVGIVLLTGCGTSRRAQLERVAKDWCETIRASQVIPVYPLTEDLQPGDVFLVQVPVDRQQQVYKEKGFLPLDNHLMRLDPTGYEAFYDSNFPLPAGVNMPEFWLRPAATDGEGWERAPNAAFPTYSFSVNSATGANLAIPISGVPVGMSLLATNSANGFVNIDDARTMGVDMMSMHAQLESFVNDHREVRVMLANFGCGPYEQPRNYLRVVTRVYATGKLEVLLNDASTVGAGLDVGVARPVDLFVPRAPDGVDDTQASARENYMTGMRHINNMGGNLGGLPDHRSGEDVGKSPEELALLDQARSDARKSAIETRTKAVDTAKESHANNVKAGKDSAEGKKWQKAIDARKDAETALREATGERRRLEKIVHSTASSEAEVADAKSKLEGTEAAPGARKAEETARENLKSKRAEEAVAHQEYLKTNVAQEEIKSGANLGEAQAALDAMQKFAPGGSVRFNAASSRSVSMDETFDPPLIIGYLGFDVGILADGKLGPPIPTFAKLEGTGGLESSTAMALAERAYVDPQFVSEEVTSALEKRRAAGDGEAAKVLRGLDSLASKYVPNRYDVFSIERQEGEHITLKRVDGTRSRVPRYGDYAAWVASTEKAVRLIRQGLASEKLSLKVETGAPQEQSEQDRGGLEALAFRLEKSLNSDARVAEDREARRAAATYYARLLLLGIVKAE
ncbi:MAG TPA: hypothetical protein VHN77_13475 [Phycisphaerales bacterium]|nr:hypothetical protein [Phycisphaerales bacterium]